MTVFYRVTDSVKPRREYTITEFQLCDDHTILADKSPFEPDGVTPLPPKYTPEALVVEGVSVSPTTVVEKSTPPPKKVK